MSDGRFLIVNADDFGLSEGINRGIFGAHEGGILTSASLMVRWPAATHAAAYARSSRTLSVGLHLDLGEMVYADGEWRQLYAVIPKDAGEETIRAEVVRQIEHFVELVGRPPTHIDSHQHRHLEAALRGIVLEQAARLGVPLRDCTPGIRYLGGFYGQSARGTSHPECIGVDALLSTLATLPDGVTELGCHPAAAIDFTSTYRDERLMEFETLCDPTVRTGVTSLSLQLVSFEAFTRGLR